MEGKFSELDVSPNGRYIAYNVDNVGNELNKLHIFDTKTQKEQVVTPEGYFDDGIVFSQDEKSIYSSRSLVIWGPASIFITDLKTGKSKAFFRTTDKDIITTHGKSQNKKWMDIVKIVSNDEQYLGMLNLETRKFKWLLKEKDVIVDSAIWLGNTLYFISNYKSDIFQVWKTTPHGKLEHVGLGITKNISELSLTSDGLMSILYREDLGP
nr:hypothetical protein [Abyssogena phaseoliformis symbiont]